MSLATRLLRKARKGRTDAKIELLSRPGCHLCEDADQALSAEFGRENVHVVDITGNDELESVYIFRIPVVLFDGQPVAEGVINRRDARLLRKRLNRQSRGGRPSA